MKKLQLQIDINSALYLKDPKSTELGQKIISESIKLIHEIGFEDFTFKKLGERINSNESSIYRYFQSKHTLLVYLTSWYWAWMEYHIVFSTANIAEPKLRLEKCIELLTKSVEKDNEFTFINEILLSEIIFSESTKAYHTKSVDEENQQGCFKSYKSVVQRVSDIVLEIKPTLLYPHMLISTVIEGAHQQKYFADHLPSLTDGANQKDSITKFYKDLVFKYLT